MRIFRSIMLFVLFATIASVVLFAGAQWQADRKPEMPEICFYGKVVDESGEPVADAEVHLSVWVVPLPWSAGKGPPLAEATRKLSLRTSSDGTFTVADKKGYMLQVLDVRKDGYDWLVDLAWSMPQKAHPDNRFFLYGSGWPQYVPDAGRPALFPLLRARSSTVASLPSRGGADRSADGKVSMNKAVTPRIPSTGPSAPQTLRDRERMLDEANSRSTTNPTGNN